MSLVYVLFTISLTLVFIYLSFSGLVKLKVKLFGNRKSQMNQIEDKHDRLRESLKELKQHFYWAQSCGEKDKEKRMEEEIFRVEDELDELKSSYEQLKAGKNVPLKEILK